MESTVKINEICQSGQNLKYLGELQACTPLLERDEMIVIGIAAVQEGLDAVL